MDSLDPDLAAFLVSLLEILIHAYNLLSLFYCLVEWVQDMGTVEESLNCVLINYNWAI